MSMSKKFYAVLVTIMIILFITINLLLTQSHASGLPSSVDRTNTTDEQEIKVMIDNKLVQFKNGFPIMYKGRAFLGLRSTGEMLGLNVSWDSKNQIAYVISPDQSKSVRVQMKQGQVYVDDQLMYIDAQPMIIDGRVFVPVRFIAEAFNKKVTYVGSTRIIYIKDTDVSEQELF